ncbi:unnamed protein product, partial [Symbiodinium necroappetens]
MEADYQRTLAAEPTAPQSLHPSGILREQSDSAPDDISKRSCAETCQAGDCLQKVLHQLVYTPVRMISDETVLQAVTIGKDVVAPEGACLWLEDLATITSSFSTFIEFYEKRDVGLMSVVLRYILMDGCAAGRLAAEKDNGLYVKSMIDFSARPGRDEQDVQLVLPPVWRAWEHVPSNFHGSTLAGAVQIWDVLRVYTFPARQAGIFVDHEMLPLFPASTRQVFAEAGKTLNIFEEENGNVLPVNQAKDMREDKPKRAGRKAEGEPVTQMLNLLMSFQEAKDLNVSGSGVLQNIFDNPLTQLPERVMAKQLVNAWSAQTRDAAEVSKYSSRSWPPRRSFAFSQSSRIDPVGQR